MGLTRSLQLDFSLEQEIANSTCVNLAEYYNKQLQSHFPCACQVCRVAGGSLSLFMNAQWDQVEDTKVAECLLSLDSSLIALHPHNKQKSAGCMLELLDLQNDIPVSPKFIGASIGALPYYLNLNTVQPPTTPVLQISNNNSQFAIEFVSKLFETNSQLAMKNIEHSTKVTDAEWKSIKESYMIPNTALKFTVQHYAKSPMDCLSWLHSCASRCSSILTSSPLHVLLEALTFIMEAMINSSPKEDVPVTQEHIDVLKGFLALKPHGKEEWQKNAFCCIAALVLHSADSSKLSVVARGRDPLANTRQGNWLESLQLFIIFSEMVQW